ncbi:MAG: 4Fe-4S binding protein [Coriobacteriia bacterium]|nr:4Fe-4S binding protein [Coriobacteriia bacterium]
MKFTIARRVILILVPVAVLVGIIWHTGTGALSSFGFRDIAYICPLGTIEAFLASWIPVPRALIVLAIVFALAIVLGKVFCAWVCPVPPLRKFLTPHRAKGKKADAADGDTSAADVEGGATSAAGAANVVEGGAGGAAAAGATAADASDGDSSAAAGSGVLALTAAQSASLKAAMTGCPAISQGEKSQADGRPATTGAAEGKAAAAAAAPAGAPAGAPTAAPAAACTAASCSSCAEKRHKLDSRHIVLGGALISSAIFGFPVFCLVCPVGLSFATLLLLWRLIGFSEVSWSLLVFPVILVLELVVLRKWCIRFCPLGALMSLMSIPNKLLKPHVNAQKCLRLQGQHCTVCVDVCEEGLDPHSHEGMQECTKCGLCIDHCPVQAITMPWRPPHKAPHDEHGPLTHGPAVK